MLKKWCRRKYLLWEITFLACQRSTFVSRRFHDFLLPSHDCAMVELKYVAFVLHLFPDIFSEYQFCPVYRRYFVMIYIKGISYKVK